MNVIGKFRILSLAFGLLATAVQASAKPDPEALRLMQLGKSERYSVARPNSSIRAGAARIHVEAPLSVVRRVVTDFDNYAKFIGKFKRSKILRKRGDKLDVYVQVPILKGAGKIWAILRVLPPERRREHTEVMRARMLDGNVDTLDAIWRLKAIDDENTQLDLELLIVPRLPVPGSVITGEVASAADKAVSGLRNRAEALARKAAQ